MLHDVGKTREFTYGAQFGITDEGRLLGHLAIGAQMIAAAAARLSGSGGWRCSAVSFASRARRGPGRVVSAGGGRGFGSAEAMALYRLNALDASVKGALEHGL